MKVLAAAVLLVLVGSTSGQNCPNCFTQSSAPPMQARHGYTSSGRAYIHICIDSSWNVSVTGTTSSPQVTATPGQTNATIWDAINDATSQWNIATSSVGNTIDYYFVFNGSNCSGADIKVKYAPHGQLNGNCGTAGATDPNASTQAEVTISEWAAIAGSSDANALLKHEVGHPLGVANVASSECPSIMNGQDGECHMNTWSIEQNDVAATNAFFNGSSACRTIWPASSAASCDVTWCIMENLNCLGCDPETCLCNAWDPGSPIIVDVDRNGYTLTSLENGVRFDLYAAGSAALTAWTASGSDDAFLVRDLNRNGVIDDGKELFGNHTLLPSGARAAHGWMALASLDANADGNLDSADPGFSELQLWTDLNHNGYTDPGELTTLTQAGVIAISLHFNTVGKRDQYGNLFRYQSVIRWADGRVTPAYDVIFVGDRIIGGKGCKR